MSETTQDAVIIAATLAVPVVAWLLCWYWLACGHPYSRARPLAVRWMKVAGVATSAELVAAILWGSAFPAGFPVVVVRTAFAVAVAWIPAFLLAVMIDALRGGAVAASRGEGD